MRSSFTLLFLLSCLSGAYAQTVTTTEWQCLVPHGITDEKVKMRNANNNLDIVQFNGRYYFAFRTAPTHFASKKTQLYIVSSADLQTWQFEQEIHHGHDLREPRFLVHDDKL